MPNARTTDPLTSKEAAESVWEPSEVQWNLLYILDTDANLNDNPTGLTDDEIYTRYVAESRQHGWVLPTPQSVRSRRSELVRGGLVEASGLYGLTVSGRRTQKWAVI